MRLPRVLLTAAAALSAIGGMMHGVAFSKARAAYDASNVAAFFGASAKGLWIADSATLLLLAVIFGLAAAKPSTATRSSLILAACIPIGTAVMLYTFLGGFFAGHLLMVIGALAIAGARGFPATTKSGTLLGAFAGKIRMAKDFDEIPGDFRD
jgi:hypothetical protein